MSHKALAGRRCSRWILLPAGAYHVRMMGFAELVAACVNEEEDFAELQFAHFDQHAAGRIDPRHN